jgi:hypothetical protein
MPSRIIQGLVPWLQYIQRCTAADERLLVAGDAPEIFIYARRGFAGGQYLMRSGFFSTPADERRMLDRLQGQQVPIALVLSPSEASLFPFVLAEIERSFTPVQEVPIEEYGSVSVRVNRRMTPTGTDAMTGLPCFSSRASR